MVAGSALLMMNNAVVKWLTAEIPIGALLAARGVFILVPVSLLAWRAGGVSSLRVHSVRGQVVRAALTVLATFMMVNSLKLLPLADVTAITFAGPLFTTCMAAWVLGERVGRRRWSAVAVGFAGILLIARPTAGAVQWAALLPLGVALLVAVRDILTRRISATETSVAMLCYTTLGVTLAGLATTPLGWRPLGAGQVGLLALAAALFAVAHFLVIESFRLAEAALVAPFRYAEIVWAVILGFVVWGTWPDRWIVAGAVLVVGSGLYILRRQTLRVGQRRRCGRSQSWP